MKLATKHVMIAAVVLWMLAIAGISQANAAQLIANTSGGLAFLSEDKCAEASLASTATGTATSGDTVYPAIELSNIPGGCQSVPINVYVHGAGGALLGSGTVASAGGASVDVTTGNYTAADVTEVVARMGGWVFPTTWTAPPPPQTGPFYCEELTSYPGNAWEAPPTYGTPTGNLCTVTVVSSTFWGNNQHFNMTFEVSGADNWRVTVDFTDPFFNGLLPSRLSSNGNPLAASGYNCSQLPTFVGQTNLGWSSNDWSTGYLSGSSVGSGGSLC